MKLTYERVREVLDYDPGTGEFVWKDRSSNKFSGKIAGTLNPNGYNYIQIDRKIIFAHRLAWLYIYGYLPEHQIDHINQVRNDNRIKNLREVSQSCNMQNQKIDIRNKSGVTGVSWCKRDRNWQVYIKKNRKQIHLGFFNNLLDAAKARYAGEQKYFNCVVKSSAEKFIKENS